MTFIKIKTRAIFKYKIYKKIFIWSETVWYCSRSEFMDFIGKELHGGVDTASTAEKKLIDKNSHGEVTIRWKSNSNIEYKALIIKEK